MKRPFALGFKLVVLSVLLPIGLPAQVSESSLDSRNVPGLTLRKGNEIVTIALGTWVTMKCEDPKTTFVSGNLLVHNADGLHIRKILGNDVLMPPGSISTIWDGRPARIRGRLVINTAGTTAAIGTLAGALVWRIESKDWLDEDGWLWGLNLWATYLALPGYVLIGTLIGGAFGLAMGLPISIDSPAIEYPIGGEEGWEIVPID